jgi:hypothetical protein
LNVGVTILKLGFGTGWSLFVTQKIVSNKIEIFFTNLLEA